MHEHIALSIDKPLWIVNHWEVSSVGRYCHEEQPHHIKPKHQMQSEGLSGKRQSHARDMQEWNGESCEQNMHYQSLRLHIFHWLITLIEQQVWLANECMGVIWGILRGIMEKDDSIQKIRSLEISKLNCFKTTHFHDTSASLCCPFKLLQGDCRIQFEIHTLKSLCFNPFWAKNIKTFIKSKYLVKNIQY